MHETGERDGGKKEGRKGMRGGGWWNGKRDGWGKDSISGMLMNISGLKMKDFELNNL